MFSLSVDKRLAAFMIVTGVELRGRTEDGSLEILNPDSLFERRMGFPRNCENLFSGFILPMGWMFLHSRPILLVEAWEKRFSWITEGLEGLGRMFLTVCGFGLNEETVTLSDGGLGWSILKEEVEEEFCRGPMLFNPVVLTFILLDKESGRNSLKGVCCSFVGTGSVLLSLSLPESVATFSSSMVTNSGCIKFCCGTLLITAELDGIGGFSAIAIGRYVLRLTQVLTQGYGVVLIPLLINRRGGAGSGRLLFGLGKCKLGLLLMFEHTISISSSITLSGFLSGIQITSSSTSLSDAISITAPSL